MVELLGFEIRRRDRKADAEEKRSSFAPPQSDDGSLVVGTGANFYGTGVDLEGAIRSEAELVTRYREMAQQADIDFAIEDIVNEAVSTDDEEVVRLNMDSFKDDSVFADEAVKQRVLECFDEVIELLDFNNHAHEIFRQWYVDGRIYYHAIVDEKNPREGIKELRNVDPRRIRKIKQVERVRDQQTGAALHRVKKEYYVYSEAGFTSTTPYKTVTPDPSAVGLQIAKDSVVHVSSGLMDPNNQMALSYLHKAIRPLNQLQALEDSTIIYWFTRAPERRVFYVDTGTMPTPKAEQHIRDLAARHKNRLTYDQGTGKVRDDRRFMCFSFDTLIPLLDGRTLTLREITEEYEAGRRNWVYSADPVTGKFVPGPVSWAGVTKRDAEVVRVTFDNGKSVVCTPDHKFPVWGKGFVEARDLVGESVIPGYRRHKSITHGGVEYEQIYKNDTGTWEFTHREVANWKAENGLDSVRIHDPKYADYPKHVIHHENFNRFDNTPDNLTRMNHRDHMLYHHDAQSVLYTDEIIDMVGMCARSFKNGKSTIRFINDAADLIAWRNLNAMRHVRLRDTSTLVFTHKDLKRISKSNGFENWRSYRNSFDVRERTSTGLVRKPGADRKGSPENRAKLSTLAKLRGPHPIHVKTWKVRTPDGGELLIENLSKFCREHPAGLNRNNIKYGGSKGYHAEQLRNHKAVSVEYLSERIDVGCLTVDLEETYHSHHTYLLDAGVYAKNTMTEDFWLARREGSKSTEIETLQGGQMLGQMNDGLDYFKQALYRALGVPVSRLDPETSGFTFSRAAEISRDEVKFSKFVDRLRRRFSLLLFDALTKHLILKNVISRDDVPELYSGAWFEFATDNNFLEIKENEVLSRRLEIAKDVQDFVGRYYSHEFVRKRVLRQTEDEIKAMDEQVDRESQDPKWATPISVMDPTFGSDASGGVGAGLPPAGGAVPPQAVGGQDADPQGQAPQQTVGQINSSKI